MSRRLLLVEDEAALSRALVRLLRRRSYEIVQASSAAAARAVTGTFRLGVFDIDLPDGDGVGLAEDLLRASVVERAVFFSGTREPERQRRAEKVATLVDKGDGFAQLMATIDRAMDSRRARVANDEDDASFEQSGGPPPSGVRGNEEHQTAEEDERTD